MVPIVHHPAYTANISEDHRFPMRKFAVLMDVLRGQEIARGDNTFEPAPCPVEWLSLAHSQAYVDQVLNGTLPRDIIRAIGFDMNPSVSLRAQCATGGTVLAARLALDHGLACNTAGGSHHAKTTHGAGFCVFNDVAVAAKVVQAEGLAKRILVIDLDVHQGDGTAEIFAGDETVFTLSFHAGKNWPSRKEVSDLDIPLRDGLEDEAYLKKVREVVPRLLDRGAPDLVFYNAGVDVHLDDRLGRLSMSDDGIRARDEFVLKACLDRSIPVAAVIGGGYSKDIATLANRHAILHRVADGLVKARKPIPAL